MKPIQTLADRLIALELKNGSSSDTESQAAYRVCEKLRRPLVIFTGVEGYRSLLNRALVLARAKAPDLAGVQIKPDGAFQFPARQETPAAPPSAAQGAATLVAELLDLLITFIGETLTLRLVHDVWPRARMDMRAEETHYEKKT